MEHFETTEEHCDTIVEHCDITVEHCDITLVHCDSTIEHAVSTWSLWGKKVEHFDTSVSTVTTQCGTLTSQ
jgi:hypothetical protein